MPKNPGNSGQGGYKMRKVVSVVAQDGNVVVELACGHKAYTSPGEHEGLERAIVNRQSWVGTRWRCEECRSVK